MGKAFFVALAILVGLGGYVYFSNVAGAPHDEGSVAEAYIQKNISSLSPEQAVLGGTFYVTQVEAADGRGTVSYEDGHIAFVADFTYTEDKYGVTITSFEIRE